VRLQKYATCRHYKKIAQKKRKQSFNVWCYGLAQLGYTSDVWTAFQSDNIVVIFISRFFKYMKKYLLLVMMLIFASGVLYFHVIVKKVGADTNIEIVMNSVIPVLLLLCALWIVLWRINGIGEAVCKNYISFVVSLIVPSTFGLPSVVQKRWIKISPLHCAYPAAEDKM
jgi:hypothetical protein